MPCGPDDALRQAALTTIGRGGQPWLSMCETQSRKAMTSVICSSESFRFGISAAMTLLRVEPRRILQERAEVGVAALLRDLGQVRRVVRALAEQRVAVDAVLAVPHVLAGDDLRRDGLGVRQLAELSVAVDGQPDEDGREDGGADDEEQAGLPLGHAHLTFRQRLPAVRRERTA